MYAFSPVLAERPKAEGRQKTGEEFHILTLLGG
jgi:hypothetical protein